MKKVQNTQQVNLANASLTRKMKEMLCHQHPRRDWPVKEFLVILVLIVSVWVFDVFVLRDSYDENYFIVQKTVRKAGLHCRDMIINKKGIITYEVETCGKRYTYEVRGNSAVVIDVVKIVGDPRKRCPRKEKTGQ